MDFEIEFNPEAELPWWAATTVWRGDARTSAIGAGDNVWEAIASCVADIPRTLQYLEKSGKHLALAKAGKARCPGCGTLRPPFTPGISWAFFCDACRGDGD